MPSPANIAVVGGWHQAAVVAACFAEIGHGVAGVWHEREVIDGLAAGHAPVYEPGLDDLIGTQLAAGRLRYTTEFRDALRGADFAFICIDTPVDETDNSDLTSVFDAVDFVADACVGPLVLCVSAQVPIGTCDEIAPRVRGKSPHTISIAYVPEFLRLGSALDTFRLADRFVIGSSERATAERVAALYAPLARPIHLTDVHSAEMAKHASNVFLATSISFANQIADLCDASGADVTEVAAILRLDRRIGPHAFLNAGLGYAGGTLGREVRALQHLGRAKSVPTDLIDAVDAVNQRCASRILDRLRSVIGDLQGVRIGLLGLTYKPDTSTLRRSAALEIAEALRTEGAHVAAYDPLAQISPATTLDLEICNNPLKAARGASALVLITPWRGIEEIDLRALAQAMRQPMLFDTGNFLDPAVVPDAGFSYFGVGRGGTPR